MYTIQALRNLYIDFSVPGLVMYFQDKVDQTVGIAGYIWPIRGGGKTTVIDAGMGQPPAVAGEGKQMFAHFTVAPGEDTASLLRLEGIELADLEAAIGKAVVTGDVVSLDDPIEENIPVAYCHDLLECHQAMDRIRQEEEIILPMHDPAVLTRHPGGKIG